MERGNCKLCLKEADLCDSHYLGRRMYSLIRELGDRIIMLSPSRIMPTDMQITDYLLCSTCEQKFSSRGEKYATSLVNRGGSFMLLDLMEKCGTMRTQGAESLYRARDLGLDAATLGYYALSVVWRGTHVWPAFRGTTVGGLQLGIHEEPIRAFLDGGGRFPPNVVVKVSVGRDEASQHAVTFPSAERALNGVTAFTFETLGVWYDVMVAERMPPYLENYCCVNSPKQYIFAGDFSESIKYDHQFFRATATLDRKLQST